MIMNIWRAMAATGGASITADVPQLGMRHVLAEFGAIGAYMPTKSVGTYAPPRACGKVTSSERRIPAVVRESLYPQQTAGILRFAQNDTRRIQYEVA